MFVYIKLLNNSISIKNKFITIKFQIVLILELMFGMIQMNCYIIQKGGSYML